MTDLTAAELAAATGKTRAASYVVYRCGDCAAVIWPNDDAHVCIECGGRNVRVAIGAHCPYCLTQRGWARRIVELVADTHECDRRAAAMFNPATGKTA